MSDKTYPLAVNQVRYRDKGRGRSYYLIINYNSHSGTYVVMWLRSNAESNVVVSSTFKPSEDDPIVMHNINSLRQVFESHTQNNNNVE